MAVLWVRCWRSGEEDDMFWYISWSTVHPLPSGNWCLRNQIIVDLYPEQRDTSCR